MELRITQVNVWFAVQYGDNQLTMLNQKSLVFHLKKFGFNTEQRADIVHMFETYSTVVLNLENKRVIFHVKVA